MKKWGGRERSARAELGSNRKREWRTKKGREDEKERSSEDIKREEEEEEVGFDWVEARRRKRRVAKKEGCEKDCDER